MRARIISASVWVMRAGSRRSGKQRASRSATPSRRSAMASSMTPPSEEMRPPSNAAVTFLPWTAGKEKAGNVSFVMAGVAGQCSGNGLVSATESYAVSVTYATLDTLPTAPSVELRKGAVPRRDAFRFPSPLIKPDVRFSRIRLSDWLHRKAHGGGPMCSRRSRSTPSSP